MLSGGGRPPAAGTPCAAMDCLAPLALTCGGSGAWTWPAWPLRVDHRHLQYVDHGGDTLFPVLILDGGRGDCGPWSCCGGGSGTLVCPSSEKTDDAADHHHLQHVDRGCSPPPCPLPRSWTVDGVPWSCCGGGSGTLVCPSSEKTGDAADTVSLIGAECDRLLPHSDAEGRLAARRRCDLVCCRGLPAPLALTHSGSGLRPA